MASSAMRTAHAPMRHGGRQLKRRCAVRARWRRELVRLHVRAAAIRVRVQSATICDGKAGEHAEPRNTTRRLVQSSTESRLVSHDPEEEFPLAYRACHVRHSARRSRALQHNVVVHGDGYRLDKVTDSRLRTLNVFTIKTSMKLIARVPPARLFQQPLALLCTWWPVAPRALTARKVP